MDTFIKDLFFGEIDPQARFSGVGYEKALSAINENEELLTKNLKGKDLHLFLDLVNAWDELTGIISCELFTRGFKIGAKLTFDTFVNE